MKKKSTLLLFSSLLISSLYAQDDALDYLNQIRQKASLKEFTSNTLLENAASSHSKYMQSENQVTHQETNKNNQYYTGEWARDRVKYQGYKNRLVGEDISYNENSFKDSIDDLMGAIYHRFIFLSFSYDEIGIANEGKFYTYVLGNKGWNEACENRVSSNGWDVCFDNKRISDSDYKDSVDTTHKLVIWPAPKTTDIPPAFFEEIPDPLPDRNVSGYPISVEFNKYIYDQNHTPALQSFTLQDMQGNQLDTITLDQNSDPHKKFTQYQYAIFPKQRLEWGRCYHAKLVYIANNTQYTKEWDFKTKTLQTPKVYTITEDNSSKNIVSDVNYTLYFVPTSKTDILTGGYEMSYNTPNAPEISQIDYNTFTIKVTNASTNNTITLKLKKEDNIVKELHLKVANSDTATAPKNENCTLSDSQESQDTTNNNTNNSNNTTPVAQSHSGAALNPLSFLAMLVLFPLLSLGRKKRR